MSDLPKSVYGRDPKSIVKNTISILGNIKSDVAIEQETPLRPPKPRKQSDFNINKSKNLSDHF